MQSTPSLTSIDWLAEPSGGASQRGLGPHWSQYHSVYETLIDDTDGGCGAIRWITQDGTGNGRVKIYTVFDTSGVELSSLPKDTQAKLVAWYILSNLHGKHLDDACHCILDAYSSYLFSLRPPLPHKEQKKVTVGSVRAVSRPTVRIDTD